MTANSTHSSEYIGPSKVAEVLGVSVSTVRRLANSEKLSCYTIPYNNYRKFKIEEVNEFKKQNSFTEKLNVNIGQMELFLEIEDKSDINKNNAIVKSIKAKSHPAHYMMHKYWGRKPHNVVAAYIENYTDPGDTILDPFMGSGVVPIEAIKHQRHGIGVDINPMSRFIAKNTVNNVDLIKFKQLANDVIGDIASETNYLYETICPDCGNIAYVETAVWDHNKLARIKGKCAIDGTFVKNADDKDITMYDSIIKLKNEYDSNNEINYPKDKVLQYVKRSGKETIDELFSERALIILSKLRDRIGKVEDITMKELLMFCFTSMLANVSNMLPGDLEKGTYKSGWVISKFWVPKVHTERNIFHCFKLRVKAIVKGKNELEEINSSLLSLYNMDATNLEFIDDNSIDYIFTDPPYGESIAYLALSQFWNSWLDNSVDYENEIIVDTYRSKNYEDYGTRMLHTFQELYRTLKDDHYLSFTFHNRNLNVWKAVMDACKKAGFILEDVTLQEQAVSSGTQGINKMNTLTGDFVYTLQKVSSSIKKNSEEDKDNYIKADNNEEFVKGIITNMITNNNGITPSKLYEHLIPIIIKNDAYMNKDGKALDIEKILKTDYEYISVNIDSKIGEHYKWEIKK